jgi:hypothetical protein
VSGVVTWPTEEDITFHVRKIMESLRVYLKDTRDWDAYDMMEDYANPDYPVLGVGGSRVAFFLFGNVVKIEYSRATDTPDSRWNSSEREWENYRNILDNGRQLPVGWGIPPMRLYRVDGDPVIVSRFIPGEKDTSGWAEDFNQAFGMADCFGQNVIVCDGVRWVVDLGE